jgi:iron complex transport system substrate-binding protein
LERRNWKVLLKKRITERIKGIILLGLVLSVALTGCGVTESKNSDAPLTETEVSEEKGNEYERVIALSESNAELWILAGGSLIATSDDALDIPELNDDAVSLGDMDHISLEAVTALEPDLLILFSTDPAQKSLGEAAEAAGINVYYTNIDGFDDYDAVIKEFTGYTGKTENYDKYVTNVRNEIDEVIKKVPSDHEEASYVLLHVSATRSKVEKNDYFASEIFNNLGLKNLAADDSSFDELSLEAVVAADPDYIFVVPRGDDEKALKSFDELFTSKPAWENLSAVKNGKYYLLDKDLFGLKPNASWGKAYSDAFDLLYGDK